MHIRIALLVLCSGLVFAASPALTYSTYLRDNFTPKGIATDAAGNVYIAGVVTVDPLTFQTSAMVVKLDPGGTNYIYVRILGGAANDSASSIAVDAAGNAYVAGVAQSPDFPVTSGAALATTPSPAAGTERSWVAKIDAAGQLVYSTLLGGSTNSFALAVAVNASGQALVSGTSVAAGFPSTTGVYSVPDTTFQPYLLELDASGKKLLFSTTGIGGNSLAVDSVGNIYVAGSTGSLTYPTTPGSYQPGFPAFQTCIAPCHGTFQGANQYVSKLDPTGSKLIFSTAVSGNSGTVNGGLAVDSAGNVYLTGVAGAGYPYTVTPPDIPQAPALVNLSTPALPFLTKLDAAGQKLIYSVPVGGLGVQVDAKGNAYAGGYIGTISLYDVAAALPALAAVPSGCLPNPTGPGASAYVSEVDAAGNPAGTQFLGGARTTLAGAALAGSMLWTAGGTAGPNFPLTSNGSNFDVFRPNTAPGAFVGAVDFGAAPPPGGTPHVVCVVDAADFSPAGPIAANQLLTIFGSGLNGAAVTFGNQQATVLFSSATQINVAVPPFPGPMQVTVDGHSSMGLQFAVAQAKPAVFITPGFYIPSFAEFAAVARNADGSLNSASNPAQLGSVISVFVNGLSNPTQRPLLFAGGGWSVESSSQDSPYVLKVNLQAPSSTENMACTPTLCTAGVTLFNLGLSNAVPQQFGAVVYLR
ncbi:MAG TPA: SBBP repeat-containing protein [Candidatus Limnocylindrales bacterium]|nr:SBBP repeat-containing protein [Candidatus Limnocylindrales bacterium]